MNDTKQALTLSFEALAPRASAMRLSLAQAKFYLPGLTRGQASARN